MRKTLTLCLIGCFLWTACADHNGSLIATSNGPEAPINQPDDGLFPGDPSGGSVNKAPGSGDGEGSSGTGGGSIGGEPGGGENGGSGGGGSGGSGSGGSGSGGSGSGGSGSGGGGPGGNGGGSGGQPVPEPSTLLLVGTGLAGAALVRRRRKTSD